MTAKKKTKKRSTKKRTTPSFQGWRTSDQDEIERRRQRGAVEPCRIETVVSEYPFYGDYRVRSSSGGSYDVEIRSLAEPLNACGCPDHAVNRLGTCKHIEAVLFKLAKGKKRLFQTATTQNSPLVEIFLDRRDGKIKVLWPQRSHPRSKLHQRLDSFFSTDGSLLDDATTAFPILCRKIASAPKMLRGKVRISQQIEPWLQRITNLSERHKARQIFDKDVAAGKRSLDLVNVPLYPYQQQGMCHLAFTERALLADEMGPWQNGTGHCRQRIVTPSAGCAASISDQPRIPQGGVGGTD